jgi:hypothetical protein
MANPFLDHSHPLEYVDGRGITSGDVEITVRESRPTTTPIWLPDRTRALKIGNLEIEAKVFCKKDGNPRKLLYQESLERIRQAGYSRHLRPVERSMAIPETDKMKGSDLGSCKGEWLSAAAWVIRDQSAPTKPTHKQEATLTIYWDPVNLVFDKSYFWNGTVEHSGSKQYDITGISLGNWVSIEKLPQELVVDLYGRPYDQLPSRVRGARMLLSMPHHLVPLSGRNDSRNPFDICASLLTNGAAAPHAPSRGVRERAP